MRDKIFSNVASELNEIFKYIDKSILDKIPDELKEHIHTKRNYDYNFKLDKSKELKDQELLQETKQILSVIFLKYCCTQDEVDEILQRHEQIKNEKEDSKVGLDELQNYFVSRLKEDNEKEECNEIVKIDDISWYNRFINKIKKFFRIK